MVTWRQGQALFTVASGGLWVVDLRTGKVVRDVQEQLSEIDELVIVPGGARVDPWSGQVVGRVVPVPDAPSGGEPLMSEGASGDDGGCGTGPTASLVGLVLAWVLRQSFCVKSRYL